MRRYLQPRRPIGARRAGPPLPAPARPLLYRPLALVFRQRRARAGVPALLWRNAAGQTITIAPRLQLILRLWTSPGEDHWHAATDASAAPAAAADGILPSSHLHIHRHDGAREVGRPAFALPPRQPADAPSRDRARAAGLRLRSGAARIGRGDLMPPARTFATGAPAPDLPVPAARAGATPVERRRRPADIALATDAGPRPRAGATRAFVAMEMRGARRRSRDGAAGAAPADIVPRLAVAALDARLARAAPARLVVAPAPGGRPVSRAAAVPRDHPAAMLELAGVARARGMSISAAASHRSGEERLRLPAPLDYRRPPPPVAAAAVEPAARAAPPPQPPVIDLDALSRDVISRIEQRLSIERERHGRM